MSTTLMVGNVTAEEGDMEKGYIDGVELTTGDSIDIPVMVMNGTEDGPTLQLFSTQHGKELQGTQVVHEIMRERVSPDELSGALIGIPVANPLGYMHQTYRNWIDNQDIGGVSVENPNGTTTERLANVLWEEAWSQSDLVANLHCNDHDHSLYFNIINPTQETEEDLTRVANAFGITTIQREDNLNLTKESLGSAEYPPTLSNKAAANGIPEWTVEFIDGRYMDEENLKVGVTGILNVMKEFDMLDGEPNEGPQDGIKLVQCKYTGGEGVNRPLGMLRPDKGGLLFPQKYPGEPIEKGEIVAEIRNLHGDIVEELEMPEEGYLWAYAGSQRFATSGGMQTIESGGKLAYAFVHEEE